MARVFALRVTAEMMELDCANMRSPIMANSQVVQTLYLSNEHPTHRPNDEPLVIYMAPGDKAINTPMKMVNTLTAIRKELDRRIDSLISQFVNEANGTNQTLSFYDDQKIQEK